MSIVQIANLLYNIYINKHTFTALDTAQFEDEHITRLKRVVPPSVLYRLIHQKLTVLKVDYIAFVLLPAVFLIATQSHSMRTGFLTLLSQTLFFGWIIHAYLIVLRTHSPVLSKYARFALSFAAATCYVGVYFLMGYWMYTGNRFDPFFLIDSYQEVWTTGFQVLGLWKVSALTILFIALWRINYKTFSKTFEYLKQNNARFNWRSLAVLTSMVALTLVDLPPAYSSLYEDAESKLRSREVVASFFPDNSIYSTKSKENVIILQLESVNGLVLDKRLTKDGKKYDSEYMPHIRHIAKDGVHFPLFWGNGIQTNRAQASILCGAVGNIKKAFSFRLKEIDTDCLPKLFTKNGFASVFLRSDRLKFANTGNYMKELGFEHRIHKEIMKEGDKKYGWGYDDCVFYDRAFDYLEKEQAQKEKLFAYVEVSSHHVPFGMKKEYNHLKVFPKHENFMEKYLNSMQHQDFCVSKFYERFRQYDDGNTHLFIVGDTSWPVGVHKSTYNERGAYTDNFLTTMVYIPPKNRRGEFKVGERVEELYSQTDMIPTIFSLLNNKSYPNSFDFAVRKNLQASRVLRGLALNSGVSEYEDCQVLTQPYGDTSISIVRGDDTYVYSTKKKTLTHFDIGKDLLQEHPTQIATDLEYEDFVNQYYCERYSKPKES